MVCKSHAVLILNDVFVVITRINYYMIITKSFRCQAIQNLGLAVISLLTGYIVQNAGYFWLEIFFFHCLSSMNIAFLFLTVIIENKGTNIYLKNYLKLLIY